MFAGHHIVGSTVGFAQNDRQFGHGRLGESVEKFSTVPDDSSPFLVGPGEETRHVLKGQNRDVEGVAKANKSGGFVAGVNVKTTCENFRLIGHNPHGVAAKMAETNHDVLGPIRLNFHESTVVQDLGDDVKNIVRLSGIVGNDAVQSVARPVL